MKGIVHIHETGVSVTSNYIQAFTFSVFGLTRRPRYLVFPDHSFTYVQQTRRVPKKRSEKGSGGRRESLECQKTHNGLLIKRVMKRETGDNRG